MKETRYISYEEPINGRSFTYKQMQEVYREGTKECKEYIIEDLFHLVGHKTFYQFIKIFNFGKK